MAFVEGRLRSRRGRGRRPGDLHRLFDEPAELRRQPSPGNLPVLDRRAQVDRPPAPRGAGGRRCRSCPDRSGRAASSRPGRARRKQHLSQRRTPPDRGTSPRRGDRRATAALARTGRLAEDRVRELLFVRGWPNKQVAGCLDISRAGGGQHQVRLLARLRRRPRAAPARGDVFSELYEGGMEHIPGIRGGVHGDIPQRKVPKLQLGNQVSG